MSGIQNLPSEQTILSKPPLVYVAAKNLTYESSGLAALPNSFNGTLTGVLTADTWKSIISVTGAGVLNWAHIHTTDSGVAGTFSYRVVIDGVTIASGSTTVTTITTTGVDLVGISVYSSAAAAWVTFSLDQLPFSKSMSIDVKHSAGETNKRTVYANYRTV